MIMMGSGTRNRLRGWCGSGDLWPTGFGQGQDTAAQLRALTEMLGLHLLQVSLVYVNTLMMQQVLAEPEWHGRLTEPDLRALTPLKWQHINPYGTFTLDMHERLPLNS